MATVIFGTLAVLSVVLLVWQCLAAWRFPLHRRDPLPSSLPGVTILKPLKGCDSETLSCLQSWFEQDYPGPVQLLFGVADPNDPVVSVVNKLKACYPAVDARLIVDPEMLGANAKVSTLVKLERVAKHELLVISDADVWIEPDLLAQAVHQLGETKAALISCPYALVNAANPAMHLEAMAANADFWSQALQAQTLKPLDFALGAVMVTSRTSIRQIGGLETLLDLLADDYQLGNRIARRGGRLRLCTLPVECRSSPVGWLAVWKHQLRWARTIRVCQPVPYFFSILSNATLWPLLFAIFGPSACPSVSFGTTIPASGVHISVSLAWTGIFLLSAISLRVLAAGWLPQKLTRRTDHWPWVWLAPFYDLLRTIVWVLAFTGKTVIWRGQRFQVKPGGRLVSS